MKKSIYLLMLAALFTIGLVAAPQDQEQSGPPANGPAAKLREDLQNAIRNATLSDDQKKTLQDAGSRLREAAEARRSGEKVDRDSVKKALAEIQKVTDSGAFKPEDQAAVKADLDAMRESHKRPRRRLRGF